MRRIAGKEDKGDSGQFAMSREQQGAGIETREHMIAPQPAFAQRKGPKNLSLSPGSYRDRARETEGRISSPTNRSNRPRFFCPNHQDRSINQSIHSIQSKSESQGGRAEKGEGQKRPAGADVDVNRGMKEDT